jgi:hypothetical protein
MLTPSEIFYSAEQGKRASNAGPLALHPLPRFRRSNLNQRSHPPQVYQFQDHLVLETIAHFRIILRLEYAAGLVLDRVDQR